MYYVCCVRGCKSSRQNAKLHKFPRSNEMKLLKWLKCLKMRVPKESLKNLFVCHMHFEKRYIRRKRLSLNAYPSLFTTDEISSGTPAVACDDFVSSSHIDHNYSKKTRNHEDHTYCRKKAKLADVTQSIYVEQILDNFDSSETDITPSTVSVEQIPNNLNSSTTDVMPSTVLMKQFSDNFDSSEIDVTQSIYVEQIPDNFDSSETDVSQSISVEQIPDNLYLSQTDVMPSIMLMEQIPDNLDSTKSDVTQTISVKQISDNLYSSRTAVMPSTISVEQIPKNIDSPRTDVTQSTVEQIPDNLYSFNTDVMPSTVSVEQISDNLDSSRTGAMPSMFVAQIPVNLYSSKTGDMPYTIFVEQIPNILDSSKTDDMPSTMFVEQIPDNLNTSQKDIHCTNDITQLSTNATTGKPTGRGRLTHRIKPLTPKCKKFYCVYCKSRKPRKKPIISRKAKRANTYSKFQELTKKINPIAQKILWMQIKHSSKKTKGRRFTEEEKLIGLSIMKKSLKCYNFLRTFFVLPSKITLNKMIANLNVEAAVNPQNP